MATIFQQFRHLRALVPLLFLGSCLNYGINEASLVGPLTFTDWMKQDNSVGNDERGYLKARDALLLSEKEFEQRNWFYDMDEAIVNHYLDHLKWREKVANDQTGFPPSRPIEDMLDRIKSSEVFLALKGLPKGGNLHSHENHQLSKRKLFEIIWSLEDFNYLYMVAPGSSGNEWNTDFFVNPPTNERWIKVKDTEYTIDDLMLKNTLINTLTDDERSHPTDSGARWRRMNFLWNRAGSPLIANYNVRKMYLFAMYNDSYDEGVTYLETRRSYDSPLYVLDPTGASNATFGKKYLGSNSSFDVEVTLEAVRNFTKLYPRFIGHKAIGYASRGRDEMAFQRALDNTLKLSKLYPGHVIGFDAVSEEDAGYSSLKFIDQYLRLFERGEASTIPLYLHTVETNWPIDLMTSNRDGDLVPTLENAYESILLAAKRVGHGKGFLKMPYLREIMKERKVAVEACVISNQLLGYDPDVRNHYAQVFHKEGIPIVLAPDDPATFGYDTVVVDWYAAYMGWGLNLGDLKKIALNSLTYNGMDSFERTNAIENKWKPSWNEYIGKMKEEACSRNYAEEAVKENRSVLFSRLLPNKGFANGNVHVYGRNFEIAICKEPKCLFGSGMKVNAIYISNQHIICPAPKCSNCNGNNSGVLLFIALDGKSYKSTNLVFNYDIDLSTATKNFYSFIFLISLTITTITSIYG